MFKAVNKGRKDTVFCDKEVSSIRHTLSRKFVCAFFNLPIGSAFLKTQEEQFIYLSDLVIQ